MTVSVLVRWLAGFLLGVTAFAAVAHGDEPHGDAARSMQTAGAPRFEAASEAFEMVGRLEGGELVLYLQRFETNEPVAQATVEIESGEQRAVAGYEAGEARYVVRDAAFVQAVSRAGSHAIVVTVTAGQDADLLEATLDVAGGVADGHTHLIDSWPMVGAVVAALAALAVALVMMRRARARREALQ